MCIQGVPRILLNCIYTYNICMSYIHHIIYYTLQVYVRARVILTWYIRKPTLSCQQTSPERWARGQVCRHRLVPICTVSGLQARHLPPSRRLGPHNVSGPWPCASGRILCLDFGWPPSCPGALDTPVMYTYKPQRQYLKITFVYTYEEQNLSVAKFNDSTSFSFNILNNLITIYETVITFKIIMYHRIFV